MADDVERWSDQQAPSEPHVVVFAEIDETFLTAASSNASGQADEILTSKRITVVLCSRMTRPQLEIVQRDLGIRAPFIAESGAAIFIPIGYFPFDVPRDRDLPGYHVIEFGLPYPEIVTRLHRIADRLDIPIVGFSDESVEQVARAQGLTLSFARLAKLREYDEPFRLVNPARGADERLWRALRSAGLGCTSSGPPEHVGAPVNLAATVGVLTSLFRETYDGVITVGPGGDAYRRAFLDPVAHHRIPEQQSRSNLPASQGRLRTTHPPGHALWIDTIVAIAERTREIRRKHTPSIASAFMKIDKVRLL